MFTPSKHLIKARSKDTCAGIRVRGCGCIVQEYMDSINLIIWGYGIYNNITIMYFDVINDKIH